jgi:predicted  nucleic acid-binding Zn-ribbon protein
MDAGNLVELEGKITKLLERHDKIKREKEQAEKRLQQRETEWHQLKGQIRQYERERIELRERLDKILGHLEQLDLA